MKLEKRTRYFLVIAITIMMLNILFVGCDSTNEVKNENTKETVEDKSGNSDSGKKDVQRYNLGQVAAVDSVQNKAAEMFADLVGEETNGEIEISVFPAGQIGGDEALAQDLARGNLHFAFLNQGSCAGMDPLLDFHYLPYIVKNFKQADALYYGDGIIPRTMKKTLAEYGIRVLGFYELEFRGLSNSKHPVKTVDNLSDLKLRVPGSKAIMGFFKQAGAQAISMPMPELYTALQQKTVDGQDNGVIITYDNKLHEANQYYTRTNHVYAASTINISEKIWETLSPEHQEIIEEAAKAAQNWEIQKERELTEEYIEKMEAEGVDIVELTPEQMDEFQAVGVSVWDELVDVYGADRIAQLKKEVNEVKDLK